MSGAGDALRALSVAALAGVDGLGRVYDSPPLQAALPHALVSVDLETDWGHKSGEGREVRLAASLFDKCERPERLRALAAAAEVALAGLASGEAGWRLVSMRFLRTRIVSDGGGRWTAIVEFRARLLAA